MREVLRWRGHGCVKPCAGRPRASDGRSRDPCNRLASRAAPGALGRPVQEAIGKKIFPPDRVGARPRAGRRVAVEVDGSRKGSWPGQPRQTSRADAAGRTQPADESRAGAHHGGVVMPVDGCCRLAAVWRHFTIPAARLTFNVEPSLGGLVDCRRLRSAVVNRPDTHSRPTRLPFVPNFSPPISLPLSSSFRNSTQALANSTVGSSARSHPTLLHS